MSFMITTASWLEITAVAAVIATFYVPLKDLLGRLRRRNREERILHEQRNRILDGMLLDWNGEAGRPGVPERPGVMARLGKIEAHLNVIDHEVTFNSGASIKDAVHRTDIAVEALSERLAEHISFSEKFQIEVVKKLGGSGDAAG